MDKYYRQNNWSGGLSDSESFGGQGTYAEAVGVDIHTKPRYFRASQALKNASGSITLTGLPVYSLKCSTGTTFFFDTAGKICQRDSTGAYGTVYVDSTGTIYGAAEHNGYIYWSTGTCLSRLAITDGWGSAVASWGTLSNSPYHQMQKNGLYLFILNDKDIASIDDTIGGGTLTLNGTSDISLTSLPSNLQYTTIKNFGIDIIAGTREVARNEECRIYRWDTVSPAWNSSDDIPESIINTFITIDNYTLAQAGNNGRLYYYNGNTLEPYKKIPGDYINKSMTCYPDATTQFRGLGLLGVSNLSGNPCNQGVYTIGQYDKNYPMALNLDHVISSGSINNVEIGTMVSSGTLLMVGWKQGTTYRIDEIDWANKYSAPYLKTISIGGSREKQKQFQGANISYKSLPSGTDVGLEYDANYGSEGTITLDNSQTGYNKKSGDYSIEAGVSQFKIKLTTSGNSTPEVEELYINFNERDVL